LFDRFGVVAALNVVYLKQRDARVNVPQRARRCARRRARSRCLWMDRMTKARIRVLRRPMPRMRLIDVRVERRSNGT